MSDRPPRVLVSNDDGLHSPGLAVLAEAARRWSPEVWIVAPARKWTAASHQVTFDQDVVLERMEERVYACSGAPADCVVAALSLVLRDRPPGLVLAGINDRRNVAEDVAYSGTMAVAREASFAGIPAIAVSSDADAKTIDPGHLAGLIALMWKARADWATDGAWLSVNLPAALPAPVEEATIGRDKIAGDVDVQSATEHRIVYRTRRGRPGMAAPGDENAVLAGGAISLVRHGWDQPRRLPARLIESLNAPEAG